MIQILSWRPYEKNTLKGFCDLKLERTGLEIRSCAYHEKNGKRWISLPARPYQDADGNRQWEQILRFSTDANKAFQRQAVRALDLFFEGADESDRGM